MLFASASLLLIISAVASGNAAPILGDKIVLGEKYGTIDANQVGFETLCKIEYEAKLEWDKAKPLLHNGLKFPEYKAMGEMLDKLEHDYVDLSFTRIDLGQKLGFNKCPENSFKDVGLQDRAEQKAGEAIIRGSTELDRSEEELQANVKAIRDNLRDMPIDLLVVKIKELRVLEDALARVAKQRKKLVAGEYTKFII